MQATDFEYRRQKLLHQFIVLAAFLTYLIDRDDIVWRFVKDNAAPHRVERLAFIVATLFAGTGAAICTWARARVSTAPANDVERPRLLNRARYLGELCYAVGLASLVPLSGFVILVGGEALRILRLVLSGDGSAAVSSWQNRWVERARIEGRIRFGWAKAVRREAVKWGILVAMIVFVVTLQDRYADVLAVASFLLGNLLNARIFGYPAVEETGSGF